MLWKKSSHFLCLLLVCFFLSEPVSAQVLKTIRSFNKQNFYFTYHHEQGIIYPVHTQAGKELATFIIRKGLAASGEGYISFEAAAWPGYFLRHQNHRLKLQQKKNDKIFLENATFRLIPGLAASTQGWFTLEAFNYPGLYIRHKYSRLFLERNDGSRLFQEDATFGFIRPLWDGKHKTVKTKTPVKKPAGNRDESVLIMLGILGSIYLGINLAFRIKQKKKHLAAMVKKAGDSTLDHE